MKLKLTIHISILSINLYRSRNRILFIFGSVVICVISGILTVTNHTDKITFLLFIAVMIFCVIALKRYDFVIDEFHDQYTERINNLIKSLKTKSYIAFKLNYGLGYEKNINKIIDVMISNNTESESFLYAHDLKQRSEIEFIHPPVMALYNVANNTLTFVTMPEYSICLSFIKNSRLEWVKPKDIENKLYDIRGSINARKFGI